MMTAPCPLWHPSPNFNKRDPSIPLSYVVLHYTGMQSAQEALDRMCDPVAEVSAHYMIDEDGAITQLVAEENRAWHAGKSYWNGITDLNSASIGIELVNPGHEFGYRPFPAAQIDSLILLLRTLYTRYPLQPAAILAHSDIAPLRKKDPGELFPWKLLADHGFGLWPVERESLTPPSPAQAADWLHTIGYDALPALSDSYFASLEAFCRRYAPDHLGKALSPHLTSRIESLSLVIKKQY